MWARKIIIYSFLALLTILAPALAGDQENENTSPKVPKVPYPAHKIRAIADAVGFPTPITQGWETEFSSLLEVLYRTSIDAATSGFIELDFEPAATNSPVLDLQLGPDTDNSDILEAEVEQAPEFSPRLELDPELSLEVELTPKPLLEIELAHELPSEVDAKSSVEVQLTPGLIFEEELIIEPSLEIQLVPGLPIGVGLAPGLIFGEELTPEPSPGIELAPGLPAGAETGPEFSLEVQLAPGLLFEEELIPEPSREIEMAPGLPLGVEPTSESPPEVPKFPFEVELTPKTPLQIEQGPEFPPEVEIAPGILFGPKDPEAPGILSKKQMPPGQGQGPKPRTTIEAPTSGPLVPSLVELLTPSPSSSRISTLSPGEAASICKMPSWALTPENWIFSGAKNFLDAYTVNTNGDYAREKYGLIGSLAYYYLGEENFRCSVGMMQSCVVSCKDVVMAVEDLEEARLVYFVLTSVSHFAAVTDLVHDALAIAQNNVGLMAPKMAFSFFWWRQETDADKLRFMLHLTISGIQQIFQFLSPFIPFVRVLDDLHAKFLAFPADLERRVEMEHVSWLFARTAKMFEVHSAHEWPGTLKSQIEPQQELGFYEHATGFRGDRTKDYFQRNYTSWDKHWWLYRGKKNPTEKRPDGRAWRGGNNNIFDQYTPEGWRRRKGEFAEREGIPPIPPSHSEYSGDKGGYLQEQNRKYQDLKSWMEDADKKMLMVKNDAARMGWSVFTGWLPQVFFGINNWLAWEEDENAQDVNAAYLAMQIQETTSKARKELRKSFEELMDPAFMASDGETMLSYAIGFGHYLPSNDMILKGFTAYDIEDKITRNIFHKALNTALKAQNIYITCTPDLQRRKKAHHRSGKEASSCRKDNTGPEDLKACVTTTPEQSKDRGLGDEPVELVCYMYKWSTRGAASRHYNERPFGSDNWENEWGVSPENIITSSVKSHLARLGSSSLVVNMEARLSPDELANPSTAGVFTVPVCISRHNWNNGIRGFNNLDKLSPLTTKKNLPCSCGYWGDETEQVWKDIGIWDNSHNYYRKELCPAQRRAHMKDPLEKYVNECHLDTRKSGLSRKIGKDGMCDLVLATLGELRSRGFSEDLPPNIRNSIWCRVQYGLFPDSACQKVPTDEPFSKILEDLDNKVYANRSADSKDIKRLKTEEQISDELFKIGFDLQDLFCPVFNLDDDLDVGQDLAVENSETGYFDGGILAEDNPVMGLLEVIPE